MPGNDEAILAEAGVRRCPEANFVKDSEGNDMADGVKNREAEADGVEVRGEAYDASGGDEDDVVRGAV
jgi:hypothetical protein